MKVAVALIMPAAFAAALAFWASSVVGRTPPEPRLAAGTVLWADRFFTNSDGLTEWLNARGHSYRVWAKRHPSAAARQRAAEREQTGSASPNG